MYDGFPGRILDMLPEIRDKETIKEYPDDVFEILFNYLEFLGTKPIEQAPEYLKILLYNIKTYCDIKTAYTLVSDHRYPKETLLAELTQEKLGGTIWSIGENEMKTIAWLRCNFIKEKHAPEQFYYFIAATLEEKIEIVDHFRTKVIPSIESGLTIGNCRQLEVVDKVKSVEFERATRLLLPSDFSCLNLYQKELVAMRIYFLLNDCCVIPDYHQLSTFGSIFDEKPRGTMFNERVFSPVSVVDENTNVNVAANEVIGVFCEQHGCVIYIQNASTAHLNSTDIIECMPVIYLDSSKNGNVIRINLVGENISAKQIKRSDYLSKYHEGNYPYLSLTRTLLYDPSGDEFVFSNEPLYHESIGIFFATNLATGL